MFKLFVKTFLIFRILLGRESTAFCEEQRVEEPIKLGAILSLSGDLQQWCGHIRRGMELAASEEAPVKVSLRFEDDRSVDKKSALTAAQKLIQIEKVDLLFNWTPSTIPVLGPVARGARVPLLTGAYDRQVAQAGPYVFGVFVNYEILPREIAEFLIKDRGARRLGLIMAADDWSTGFEIPFREEIRKLGADLIFAETIAPSEKDTRPLILKLKKENVDAVLAPLYSSALFSFLKTAREMRYAGSIHVGDGMFEEDLKTVGSSAEGVYASQIWLESAELSAAFRRHFGETVNPLQLGLVATGYDTVRHIQGAVEQIRREGKKVSRELLGKTLQTFRSRGYLGEQMYGAAPLRSGELTVIVRDGRFVPAPR